MNIKIAFEVRTPKANIIIKLQSFTIDTNIPYYERY